LGNQEPQKERKGNNTGARNMPKIKTNSGAKKRFRITKKGKVIHAKGYKSHLLECKSAKRRRRLRKAGLANDTEYKRLRRMLPYS